MAFKPRFEHQRQQFADVVVVHAVHRGEVRSRHAPLESETHGFGCQRLDVPGERIVRLIAVHVDAQTPRLGDFAQLAHRRGAVGHRALEVRNAADDVDAAVESTQQVGAGVWAAQEAVLRKRDEL